MHPRQFGGGGGMGWGGGGGTLSPWPWSRLMPWDPMGSGHTPRLGSQMQLWSGTGGTEQLFPAAGDARIGVLESTDGRGTGVLEERGPAGWVCPLQTCSPPYHLSGTLHPHAGPSGWGRMKASLPGPMGFCNNVFHGAGRKPRE